MSLTPLAFDTLCELCLFRLSVMILKALKARVEVQSIQRAASVMMYLCKCLFQTQEIVINYVYGMVCSQG